MGIVNNEKEFKVLKLNTEEAQLAGMGIVEGCICMHCNTISNPTYYIAVLNDCMCEKCYKNWVNNPETKNYPEDRKIEQRNYKFYLSKLYGEGI